MDYHFIYNSICQKAKLRNVGDEMHHIIPKCLGGTDDKSNLVPLTYREHFVAHKLLVKIYDKNVSLHRALLLMKNRCFGFIPSRLYQKAKSMKHLDMKNNNPMFNVETVKKQIKSRRQKPGYNQSEVAKKRNVTFWSNEQNRKDLSARNKERHLKKGIYYIVTDITNNDSQEFRTKAEAATKIGVVPSTVYNYCKSKKILHGKWRIDSVAKSNPQNSD